MPRRRQSNLGASADCTSMFVSWKPCDTRGGVISPLLANLYLNEVNKMLERAKEVTRNGRYTHIE